MLLPHPQPSTPRECRAPCPSPLRVAGIGFDLALMPCNSRSGPIRAGAELVRPFDVRALAFVVCVLMPRARRWRRRQMRLPGSAAGGYPTVRSRSPSRLARDAQLGDAAEAGGEVPPSLICSPLDCIDFSCLVARTRRSASLEKSTEVHGMRIHKNVCLLYTSPSPRDS